MSSSRKGKHLSKAINELPRYSPEDGLWDKIEQELDSVQPQSKKSVKGWLKYAATLLVLVACTFLATVLKKNTDQIHYEVEYGVINYQLASQVQANAESDFQNFISIECSGDRHVCDSKEFQLLVDQLNEVDAEVQSIAKMIEQTGFDEMLYKAKSKADSETIRIKKELVKLLRG